MKILVTGANGYLGTGVVKQLCDDGIEVVAACHSRANMVDKRAEIRQGDIFAFEEPFEQLGRPDILLHMAWRNGFVHDADSHIEELSQHYLFLKNMLNGGLKHLVVMGTMHEIGYWEGSIDENTPANPISKYGIAKNCLRQSIFNFVKAKEDVVLQWLRTMSVPLSRNTLPSIFFPGLFCMVV